MLRCAVLDDYQNVALRYADWSRLAGKIEVRVFNEHFEHIDALAAAIGECEIVVAIRERWIAGAALDVFDPEPLPTDHPLRSAGNLVATPHLGYVTEETLSAVSCRCGRRHPGLARRRAAAPARLNPFTEHI